MRIFSVILLNILVINAYCCKCKTITKERNFELSDIVFTGEVIMLNDNVFHVKVDELFKGADIDTIIVQYEECSVFPKQGEYWLFYANKLNDAEFIISKCSWSRSFNRPFTLMKNNLPQLPPPNASPAFIDFMNHNIDNMAILELQLDILNLRELKSISNLKQIEASFLKFENKLIKEMNQIKWCVYILSFLVTSFIIFKTMLTKKSKIHPR